VAPFESLLAGIHAGGASPNLPALLRHSSRGPSNASSNKRSCKIAASAKTVDEYGARSTETMPCGCSHPRRSVFSLRRSPIMPPVGLRIERDGHQDAWAGALSPSGLAGAAVQHAVQTELACRMPWLPRSPSGRSVVRSGVWDDNYSASVGIAVLELQLFDTERTSRA